MGVEKKENDLFCQNNPRLIEHHIIDFVISLKEKGLSYSAIHNYVATITAFYKINDIILNTTKINKFLPEYKKVKKDRAYTHEEIHTLLDIADERFRAIILILASTGIRIGALSVLKLKHLQHNKLVIYENTNEEYVTFITPECQKAIDLYIDMRSRYGEKLDPECYLIREQFDVRAPASFSRPKQTNSATISKKLMDLAQRAGVRNKEVPIAHGFRKFFTTELVNSKVNPEIREMLLGHKIGLASCYYRPSVDEMYSEYEKAIDNLTIDPANRLQRKIETLTIEKSRIDRIEEKMLKMEQMYQK